MYGQNDRRGSGGNSQSPSTNVSPVGASNGIHGRMDQLTVRTKSTEPMTINGYNAQAVPRTSHGGDRSNISNQSYPSHFGQTGSIDESSQQYNMNGQTMDLGQNFTYTTGNSYQSTNASSYPLKRSQTHIGTTQSAMRTGDWNPPAVSNHMNGQIYSPYSTATTGTSQAYTNHPPQTYQVLPPPSMATSTNGLLPPPQLNNTSQSSSQNMLSDSGRHIPYDQNMTGRSGTLGTAQHIPPQHGTYDYLAETMGQTRPFDMASNANGMNNESSTGNGLRHNSIY
jgi:hypothetical protein